VLNAELAFLGGLKFQLVTYSPYRSLEGFRNDMEEKLNAGDAGDGVLTKETLDECVAAACKIADQQMLTVGRFRLTPG